MLFRGPVAEWTASQKKLVSLTKEYLGAFSLLNSRGHRLPDADILGDYKKFREWFEEYTDDPDAWDDPYLKGKYNHGFSTRTK